jgi:uncharacterized protein YgbK (DUF1537 family)
VGRTVRAGILYVHGVPVAETDFARDPVSPVRDSALARLLGAASLERVTLADAATEDDLDAAVARMDAAGGAWVAVGSGALARPVAMREMKARVASHAKPAAVPPGPVLMLGGSAHVVNRAQAELLRREGGVPRHEAGGGDFGPVVAAAVADCAAHGHAMLELPSQRMESAAALRSIIGAAVRVIEAAGVTRVFATGGETAFALCGALGIRALEFGSEIEPGLSLSRGEARQGPILLAVKPGGFGDERTWLRAWTELRTAP